MSHHLPQPLRYLIALVVPLLGCAPAAGVRQPADAAVITAEDIARYPGEAIELIIERRIPGVTAYQTPDGRMGLRIRGVSSWDGRETPPLYVLNGVPIGRREGALSNLNPADIDTIRVLMGADAAVYGIDGANGVIVVTTKRS